MKICIFGAGAVGGMIGGELARTGQDVTLIARGAHLAAMRRNGLTVHFDGEERHSRPFCTDNPAEAGVQDAVIFMVKAHQLAEAARQAQPLLGPDTVIVAGQNGIPWWYFHGVEGALANHCLAAVDPGRRVWEALGPERVVGGVINGSCALIEPGVISHHQTSRSLTIGEPAATKSDRCQRLAEAFAATDVDVPIAADIREATWTKLLNNIGGGMLCVLTRSTHGGVNSDPACYALVRAILEETGTVAASVGVDISAGIAARQRPGPGNHAHKPSTLQDLEAGRAMEIDVICGAVLEIARLTGTATPVIDNLYALLRRLAEATGTYPANGEFTPVYGNVQSAVG